MVQWIMVFYVNRKMSYFELRGIDFKDILCKSLDYHITWKILKILAFTGSQNLLKCWYHYSITIGRYSGVIWVKHILLINTFNLKNFCLKFNFVIEFVLFRVGFNIFIHFGMVRKVSGIVRKRKI